GSVLTFDGFYRIWERDDEREEQLPDLHEGEILDFHGLVPEQHFTQPPPRYTEATLINELEKRGIGRPSTYATIVATIQDHSYVDQRERRLHPTQLGEAVNSIMVGHFQDIVDDRYTAAMEERLDEVEQGRVEWVPVVGDFYVPLERMLSAAAEAMPAETGEECPECHEGQLVLKASRYGPFKGCSRYPACRYRRAGLPHRRPGKAQRADDPLPRRGRPPRGRGAGVRGNWWAVGAAGTGGRGGGTSNGPSRCRPARCARNAARASWSSGRAGTGLSGRAAATPTVSFALPGRERAGRWSCQGGSTSLARSAASRWWSARAGMARSSHAATTPAATGP